MILNRKTVTHGTLGLLAVLFVALALLSNTLFRGARLDLTEIRSTPCRKHPQHTRQARRAYPSDALFF